MWMTAKFLLTGAIALFCSQNSTPNPDATAKTATADTKLGSDAAVTVNSTKPVITVHGVCEKTTEAGTCTTVVTHAQFESLLRALNPGGQPFPSNTLQTLARNYAEFLAVEAAARKAGMEETPEFQQLMTWIHLKTVTDLYRHSLEEKYRNPTDEESDAYYQQHVADFERVELTRVLIPRENASAANKDEFEKKARDAAQTARENLAKGQDALQVQKDAYTALGLAAPPHTDLGERRRNDLIAEEAKDVFALNVGQVSQVESELGNYVIYKVTAKRILSKKQAKTEIARAVYQENFKDAMKAILDVAPAEYDEQYLQPAKASIAPASSSAH